MSLPEKVHCLIRKEWVAPFPEECVRQALLHKMVSSLGFPAALIGVERELKQMPHLAQQRGKMPARRADIVCFGQNIHPLHSLYPLLVIECKAVKLTSKVVSQVVGYNHYLGAYYIAMANQSEIKLGWYDPVKQEHVFVDFLPTYNDLIKVAQSK